MTEPQPQTTYVEGELVDIRIRGARVVNHTADKLTVHLAGHDLDVLEVPLQNDAGDALPAVTMTYAVPDVRPGEVWESADEGHRFFVAWDLDRLRLLAVDGSSYDPEQATFEYGQLVLVSGPPGATAPPNRTEIPLYSAMRHVSRGQPIPPHPGHPDAWPDAFTAPDRGRVTASAPVVSSEEITAALPSARNTQPEGAAR